MTTLRTILGMPNYKRYIEHCRERHPGEPVLSEAEYYSQHLARRYGNGPSRCC
jgi:uncharacterized short protein YbdD (DUF466 family)